MLVRCRASHYTRGKSALGSAISTFTASLEFVVAVGDSRFALVEARLFQSEFEMTRRIDGSNPEFLSRPTDVILKELQVRGKQYVDFCTDVDGKSGHVVHYSAASFWAGKNAGRPSRTGGRMMVDTIEAWARGVHAAKAPADGQAGDAVLEGLKTFARWRRQRQQQVDRETSASSKSDKDEDVSDLDVLLLQGELPQPLIPLTWPVVCGFSLDTRNWGLALVDGLQPVLFQESAFDSLVLPVARKRLLRALVTSHGQKETRADILPGKGEGIIFLLHGPPGVGKTLTAEAVCEVLHRPLYRVSMGELGTTPETLEKRLQDIFELCLPWQAVVLIDEAEMLLETRLESNDLIRNAMVCVMLRLLEYYPGILFLTTNTGMDRLDPAIASRLTCALHYEALNVDARFEIWQASLERVKVECSITGDEIKALAEDYHGINGRQIKNSVQLASALCQYEGTSITTDVVREMLEMTTLMTTTG